MLFYFHFLCIVLLNLVTTGWIMMVILLGLIWWSELRFENSCIHDFSGFYASTGESITNFLIQHWDIIGLVFSCTYLFTNNCAIILQAAVEILVCHACVLLCHSAKDSRINNLFSSKKEKFWTTWLHHRYCLFWRSVY